MNTTTPERKPTAESARGNCSRTLHEHLGVMVALGSIVAVALATSVDGVTLAPGDILVADGRAVDGNGALLRIDPASGNQTVVSSGGFFSMPTGVTIGSDGTIYVLDRGAFGGTGGVIEVDPETGNQHVISPSGYFAEPFAIACAPNGDLLITDLDAINGNGAVIRVDPSTGTQTVLSSGNTFRNPKGIAVATNGDIYVTDSDTHLGPSRVVRVDPVTGVQTVIPTAPYFNFVDPFGVVVDSNGDLLVLESRAFPGLSGGVLRVNPTTGVTTILVSGAAMPDPIGIALAENGTVAISDIVAETLLLFDPVTLVLKTNSSDNFFVHPTGVAIVPGHKYEFAGFLAPMGGADESGGSFGAPIRTLKLGSTIPVKFTASLNGSAVTNGLQTLQVIKYTSATTSEPPIDATPRDRATTGNEFRFTDGEWHFNLDTKGTGMSVGVWQLVATLGDGSEHRAWIELK